MTQGTTPFTFQLPTVSDNLLSQGTISSEVVGIYFEPSGPTSSGELTFGGVDDSKITSSISYVPTTSAHPASFYWGIKQSVSYGGWTIMSGGAGFVDTGTTLVLLSRGKSPACNLASQNTMLI